MPHLLEDVARDVAELAELFVDRVEKGAERAHLLGLGNVPVDGGEVLALRELLVEAPEDLHDAERRGGDGVGEVAAGGRDGADDGDGSLALGRAEAAREARALLEAREARAEVGGVARIGGHLAETARNLTERLGPARGRVGHHRDVHAHVAILLGERDARVDGGLARSDGHVGSVRDEARALHDADVAAVDLRG
jgi:hypothetical protein